MSMTYELDIALRMEEFEHLQDGWMDGEGITPKKEELEWFVETFEQFYDASLPLPALSPTIDGGIYAEWSISCYDVSLEINLPEKSAVYKSLKLCNDEQAELFFDLSTDKGWQLLNKKIDSLQKK